MDTSTATAAIETDLSDWPVIVVRPPKTVSDDQMRAYLDEMKDIRSKRRGKHAMVLDLRGCDSITPTQRKMLTDGMGTRADLDSRCVGLAMVFNSTLLRGILTAIFWVRRPSYPTQVFTDVAEAKTWVHGLLASPA